MSPFAKGFVVGIVVVWGYHSSSVRFPAVLPPVHFPVGANVVAVSGGLMFAGYQLLVYGWSQIQGGNAGFFDILWPGRYKGNPLTT